MGSYMNNSLENNLNLKALASKELQVASLQSLCTSANPFGRPARGRASLRRSISIQEGVEKTIWLLAGGAVTPHPPPRYQGKTET